MWTGTYSPFGQQLYTPQIGPPNSYLFTGKERDSESGLDNFGARYYASTMGRFMSPDPGWLLAADPTNPQSWDMYAYVLNNPLTNVDPTGMDCVTDNGPGTVTTNAGDCANESEEAANHEYYINCDGCTASATGASLDTPTGTLTLTGQGGNSITDQNGNAVAVQGFADPQGTPATNVTVNGYASYLDTFSGYGIAPDIDSQRIQQLAVGVINFGIPNVCGFGINARVGRGRVSLGADLSTNKGLHGAAGVRVAQLGNVQGGVSIKGGNVSATVNVRVPDTPFSVGAGTNGSRITSANVSARYGVLNLQGYAAISNFADPNCH